MNAWVAGATGYTGQEVVRLLTQRGVATWAHIRPGSSSLQKMGPQFEGQGAHVDSTPWDVDALAKRLKEAQIDVVFFLIGTTKKRMKQLAAKGADPAQASYEAIDYGLGKVLLDAALASSGQTPSAKPKYIYLSSMGVGPKAMGEYLSVRWRLEQTIRSSGLQHVIARPGIITGEDRDESRPMEHLGGKVSNALFKGLGALGAQTLEKRYRATDATELATALVNAALDDELLAHTLEAEQLKYDS